MKQVISILLLVLTLAPAGANIGSHHAYAAKPRAVWLHDLNAAKRQAQARHEPLFVIFSATWCEPCQMMEKQTFPSPQVDALLSHMVCVLVDVDKNQALASKYHADAIPRILLYKAGGGGKAILDDVGYSDSDSFAKEVRHALK